MDERRDEQMGGTGQADWSAGPEVDDSGNPTDAAPGADTNDFGGERVSTAARSGEEAWQPGAGTGQGASGSESGQLNDPVGRSDAAPTLDPSEDFGGDRVSTAARSGEETWTPEAGEQQGGSRGVAGREMLVQLQQMIDTVATQAAPVMREVAAKAAELAAVAGEKAGPVAYRAAGVTQKVGERVAARSKEYADQLRRQQESGASADTQSTTDAGSDAETTASADAGRVDDPMSSDWRAT